jgi:hypothetical protein
MAGIAKKAEIDDPFGRRAFKVRGMLAYFATTGLDWPESY